MGNRGCFENLLSRFTDMSREVLGDALEGIYLHGSAVMGCFNPEKSDLDLIVVVNQDIPNGKKREFMEHVVRLNEEAPAKGIELSVVKREFCRPFVYPTPYELHFSRTHLKWFCENPSEYVEKMRGTDKDLAAHFTIIRKCGRVLYGAGIENVFGEVPEEDYADSILADIAEAREEISANPMYMTLNLCRVLAYLRKALILSKKDGGKWGLDQLPERFHPLICAALRSYASDGEMSIDSQSAQEYADYMLAQIRQLKGKAVKG